MNKNISRGLNMLTQLRSYEPPKWASSLKDIPQFFVQVSNFDIERFSLDCRKTKTKVNTLANQRA